MVRTLYTLDDDRGNIRYYVRQDGEVTNLWSKIKIDGEVRPYKPIYDVTGMSAETIEAMLEEREMVNWSIHHLQGPRARVPKERTICQNRDISKEFDGQSVAAVLALRNRWTYMYLENAIKSEGGTIDSNGIIHRAV